MAATTIPRPTPSRRPHDRAGPKRGDCGRKVFVVGLSRTGTTSLGRALERIGYEVCHRAGPLRTRLGHRGMMKVLERRELGPVFEVADRYQAFHDNPWQILFREMDARFPGSRFILTVRDESRWLESVVRYFGESTSDFREWIYGVGSPVGHEDLFLRRYRRHNLDVREHFRGRSDDLLVLDLEAGHGWSELCSFLDLPIPDEPFPHLNRSRGNPLHAAWSTLIRRVLPGRG